MWSAQRLSQCLRLAWVVRNVDCYGIVWSGRRQKESPCNLIGNTLPKLNPLGAFVLALKLGDCVVVINGWALSFSGIPEDICLWVKLQLHSTKYCTLLPIGTVCESVIYCRLRLEMRQKLFPVRVVRRWHRVPREAVAAKPLAVFKARLDRAWSKLLQWKVSLPWQGVGTGWALTKPICDCVINSMHWSKNEIFFEGTEEFLGTFSALGYPRE